MDRFRWRIIFHVPQRVEGSHRTGDRPPDVVSIASPFCRTKGKRQREGFTDFDRGFILEGQAHDIAALRIARVGDCEMTFAALVFHHLWNGRDRLILPKSLEKSVGVFLRRAKKNLSRASGG